MKKHTISKIAGNFILKQSKSIGQIHCKEAVAYLNWGYCLESPLIGPRRSQSQSQLLDIGHGRFFVLIERLELTSFSSLCVCPFPGFIWIQSHASPVMHRHKMSNRSFSLKIHSDDSLSHWACTKTQVRLGGPPSSRP